MQKDGDIMEFYVSGDVAPGERFKYQFTTVGAKADEEETSNETAEETTATTTDAPSSPAETTAPTETEAPAKKGCKSTVPSAAIPLALAVGAVLSRKKKKVCPKA